MAVKEKYPSLTPQRSVRLLRSAARARGTNDPGVMSYELGELCDALENHVLHALSKSRRRKRK